MVKNAVPFAVKTAVRAGGAMTGKVVARVARRFAKQSPGTVLGSVIEGGVGLVTGMLVSTFVHREFGEWLAVGGVMAPAETFVNRLQIPFVSDSLGDDGFFLGDGLGLVGDDDTDFGGGVSGYVPGRTGDVGISGYVDGDGIAA